MGAAQGGEREVQAPRTLVIDRGNSRCKAACFDAADQLLWTDREPATAAEEPADVAQRISHWRSRGFEHCVIGTVLRETEDLEEALARAGVSVDRWYRSGAELPVETAVAQPETLGVDRIAACLGAHHECEGAAVVVDCGTAITVDWIDARGVFQGGVIVPGRRLAAASLADGTSQLPRIEPWGDPEPLPLPGRSTEEAIRHGLDRGIPAMVDGLVQLLRSAAGPAARLWSTGGDGEWYVRRSRLPFQQESTLVGKGLLAAFRRDNRRASSR
jgi:type III pantothenate kinase